VDPDSQPKAVTLPIDGRLHRCRTRASVRRRSEHNHQPVAETLDLVAGMRRDRSPERLEMTLYDSVPITVAEPLDQPCRRYDVGEQHRHRTRQTRSPRFIADSFLRNCYGTISE